MFKKVYFYCDRLGNPLGENKKGENSGCTYFEEKPLVLLAKHCNAKYFSLVSASKRWERGEVPALYLQRHYGPIKKDPYNDDGRPPITMLSIVMPHVTFIGGAIEIIGVEDPNLCWAGWMIPPYYEKTKRINRSHCWQGFLGAYYSTGASCLS
jgi:hypothetical protein